MKRKKKMTAKRLLIFLIMLSGMMTLGVSYAAWNSELHIGTKMTSGRMNILFRESFEEKYSVDLIDVEDRELPLDVEVHLKDEGEKAEMRFKSGLPIDRLIVGDRIRVKFPLKADEGSIALINEREIKEDKPDEKLEMKAQRGMLIKQGKIFEIGSETGFMLPLEFEVYRGVETDEHRMTGIVFLKLTAESIAKIQELPKTIFVNDAQLQPSVNVSFDEEKLAEKVGSGIAVIYSCELPFMVEQKDMTPLGENGGK